MVANVDRTAAALALPDRPPLRESGRADDGRLIHTLAGVDVVGAAVGVEATLVLGTAAGVIGAEVLDDVVFDQRVAEPAVKREVSVAAGVELRGVGDRVVATFEALSTSCLGGLG